MTTKHYNWTVSDPEDVWDERSPGQAVGFMARGLFVPPRGIALCHFLPAARPGYFLLGLDHE